MFEPGDRVTVVGDEMGTIWGVIHAYKMWHDQAVTVRNEKGETRVFPSGLLQKFEEIVPKPEFSCNGDFCEIVREEMRLE